MEAYGLTREDFEAEEVEVFPCCWESAVFLSVLPHGAWEMGAMGGRSRLDYAVIKKVMFDQFGIKKRRRRQIMADLMVMECPALEAINKK